MNSTKPTIYNNNKEGPIRCIFFCEFHHTAGPIISCQVPESYISKELFDSISVYIITKAELQRSTITVTLQDYKVLGFPVRIDNKKYARNAFHFNLCFVCDSDARTVQYEHVVTKFSEYLLSMEVENCFLSKSNPGITLAPILKTVMEDLNTKGECALTEGPVTTHLKVCSIRTDPLPVLDHQVPIFVRALPPIQWDLTTQQVTPYIDGFNHVARIALLSDVDNVLVKACVQNLVYYGVIALVPLFQYGNIYCNTPKLTVLAHDTDLQDGQYHWDSLAQSRVKYMFYPGYFFGHAGGWLSDKIGARHVLGTSLLTCALLNFTIPFLITVGGEYWGFIFCVIARFVIGVTQGSIVPTIATFIGMWAPKKERAMLGGVAYGGSNLGNILGIIVTGAVIYYTESWKMPFYLYGVMAIVWYLFFLFTVFSYPETHPYISEEEKTFLIENTTRKSTDNKLKVPWLAIAKSCPVWAILAAQVGHNYVLFMMNTDLPKFVKDYLKMNIKRNGIVSALPFVFCWINVILAGIASDFITNRNLMNVLALRKIFTIVSIMVPAACNLLSVYVGCSRELVIFLTTFGMFWMGPFWSALKVNVNDVSKHYGGILMGIVNGIGAWSGLFAPAVTGYLTKDGSLSQWRAVFWVMLVVAIFTSAVYMLFASATRQEWDYWEGEQREEDEPGPS